MDYYVIRLIDAIVECKFYADAIEEMKDLD